MKLSNGLIMGIVLAFPISALASSTTLTFHGEVTSQTCKVSIGGETNSTILLPSVSVADLSEKGKTAGLTPFSINITGCEQAIDDIAVTTNFLGHNVTPTGNLGNLAKDNPAKNVSIQITKSASGDESVVLNGLTAVEGVKIDKGATATSYNFGVRYYAEDVAEAGAVTSIVEYSVIYN